MISHPAAGTRARINEWADFVYMRRGGVAHIRPYQIAGRVLCGRPPALFEGWFGTGSQAEYDRARRMPLCIRCEHLARGRIR